MPFQVIPIVKNWILDVRLTPILFIAMEIAKLSANIQKPSDFSSIEWLSNLAVTKHKEGKLEEAIAFYSEIIALDANQPCSLYINLISLMIKLDMLDKAIAIAERALVIHPNADEIHRTFGLVLGQKNELNSSIQQYERALKIEILQPEWVFINLAKTLLHINRSKRALEVCQTGLKFYAQSEHLTKIQHKILAVVDDCPQEKSLFTNSNLAGFKSDLFTARNVFRLNEYIVYLEWEVKENWDIAKTKACFINNNHQINSKIYYFTNVKDRLYFIAIFAKPIDFNSFNLLLTSAHSKANLEVKFSSKVLGLELADYLNTQFDNSRHIIKENICYGIINNTSEHQIASSQELIKKLQSFIKITPQFCNDINEPFSIYFDLVIPIQGEGLFINGWMSDPFEMLAEINAISSLGFAVPLKQAIHYVERPDIKTAINNTSYKGINKQHGIIAYVPFSEEIKRRFKPYAQQSNFRFEIELKGNISINVIPKTTYYQGHSGMAYILNSFTAHQNNISLLKECIAPATLALGKACSQELTAVNIQTIGKSIPDNPLVSIIIPLNKNFDLIKVQFAMMANDDSVRNSELIYILNASDRQHQWERVLESCSYLYNLPVKLITTELGSNYGALANTGAAEAKSNLCLSMLPDVLPKTENWVSKMAEFYAGLSNPGVVTPKLIYEDLSIQHAGMTCEQVHADWSYKHFYRGLPSTYPPTQKNRAIPAANGACMMFSRQLHQNVKGLAAEYLTPESEAFDFCLKSLKSGCENWYFSEVEMYYFEQQNYFTDFINHYNLESQGKKWDDSIARLSDK